MPEPHPRRISRAWIALRGWPRDVVRAIKPGSADTFGGRLWLLIIDKVVIGAIVAAAFYFYDSSKTRDSREFQARQAEIQLQFERSRLVREFLPVIQDDDIDLVTRGYVLRSAVLAQALDADAAFEVGQDFLRAGLSENHYKRIVAATLPESVGAFARRGLQIANEWRNTLGSFPRLDAVFNPVSGVEYIPEDAPFVKEGRLLRDVLYENLAAFNGCVCPEITVGEQIPYHLVGLFVLLQTSDYGKIDELSRRPEKALQLLGMVIHRWRRVNDQQSEEYLENELGGALSSESRLHRARILVRILRWVSAKEDGFGSPAFGRLLAKVATGQLPEDSFDTDEEVADYYWLRWEAAEALLLAEERATEAVPIVVEYLNRFRNALSGAEDEDRLRDVSIEYESAKIIRPLVSVLGMVPRGESGRLLREILEQGEGKLHHFPFLKSDLARTIQRLNSYGATVGNGP